MLDHTTPLPPHCINSFTVEPQLHKITALWIIIFDELYRELATSMAVEEGIVLWFL
jgi:hypothetical protein